MKFLFIFLFLAAEEIRKWKFFSTFDSKQTIFHYSLTSLMIPSRIEMIILGIFLKFGGKELRIKIA